MNKNRILLITKAVHEVPGACLLNLLWDLREIDHMAVSSDRLTRCETRFRGTFTKLKVLDPPTGLPFLPRSPQPVMLAVQLVQPVRQRQQWLQMA